MSSSSTRRSCTASTPRKRSSWLPGKYFPKHDSRSWADHLRSALKSPQILELSGIGRRDVLEKAGVTPQIVPQKAVEPIARGPRAAKKAAEKKAAAATTSATKSSASTKTTTKRTAKKAAPAAGKAKKS